MNARLNVSKAPLAPGPTSTPRMTTSGHAPQHKLKEADKWGLSVYRCSRHSDMDYRVKDGRRAVCPMCDMTGRYEQVRQELTKVTNANDLLKRDMAKLRAQLSSLDGMREAVSELSREDAMFLKELIYRYRANPKKVRVTQQLTKRKVHVEGAGTAVRHEVTGFDVEYRDGPVPEPISHTSTSIGGKMIALQFSEALKVTGLKGAMEALTRAMSETMANADD